jgi:polysaccharide chain length determinant protein (PEP-CTERM system associated)
MSERLEALVQEILSRPRLRAIVDRYKVYPALQGVRAREKALRRFRSHIGLVPAESPTGKSLLQTFRLTFTHADPQITFEVTKALSNLFIEESVVTRRSEVQGTEEFLDAQLRESRQKLEEIENLVQRFVSKNYGKLPEHLDQAVARLENAQAQLTSNTQLIGANLQRKANLEGELVDAQRVSAPVAGGGDGGEGIEQLEAALALLRSRYSEEHPDVVATKRRLEAFRSQGRNGRGTRGGGGRGTQASPLILSIKRQLGEVDVALTSLKTENEHLKGSIADLQKDIEQMPVKEQELLKTQRDYANVRENYERLLAAKEETGLQLSMIRSQKASQFGIVEPAEMPVIPAGPPRLIILAGGIVGGVASFLALPFLLMMLSHSYYTRSEVEDAVGCAVLAVVPPLGTKESKRAARGSVLRWALWSGVATVVGGAVIGVVL